MRDYKQLAINKAITKCAYFRTEIKDSFRKRHNVIDDLGIPIVQHNIREYRVWYEILITL